MESKFSVDENFREIELTLKQFLGIDLERKHLGITVLSKGENQVKCRTEYVNHLVYH